MGAIVMARAKPRSATPKKQQREDAKALFLKTLATTASVSAASKAAKIDRKTAYEWRQKDAPFAEAWDDALETSISSLETEARRRALKGTSKPVYQGGELVGSIQEYSDTLMIFLLKAHRPNVYRERVSVEHSGEVRAVASDEHRAELITAILERAGKTIN
ncbi:MAG: terminase [Pleurocapsa sp. SU_196_0]|nr:terminase [Pleurocapsa sp. SU_196_0]